MISVFTPTYNRAHLLPRLYESLCGQSGQNFEWIIVDDGSTDNTEDTVAGFIAEKRIDIRYVKQENGGKHRAINKGIQMAKGELFIIVDSDDALTSDALERISFHYNNVRDDARFAGVCGLRAHFNGKNIVGGKKYDLLDCNSIDLRYHHKITGDMAEVIRTNILREYPMPEFTGEKFCPEAILWNRISQKYILRNFYEKIYLCDYLPGGLTDKITRIRMESPRASMLCYQELSQANVPFKIKLRSAINYWRFATCSSLSLRKKMNKMTQWLWLYPVGVIMHLRDSHLLRENN